MRNKLQKIRNRLKGLFFPTPKEVHDRQLRLSFRRNSLKLRWRKLLLHRGQTKRSFIVVNLTEHLGDIIACEPISRYLRQIYPDAYIVWSVKSGYRELIDNNPHIDETLVIYCLTEWICLKQSNIFDKVIDLHLQGRRCPTCQMILTKSEGNTSITEDNYFHFGNLLAVFCQNADLPTLSDPPKVYIPASAGTKVASYHLPDQFVAVHCTSVEASKGWPKEKWEELVQRITIDLGVPVVEIGLTSALDVISGNVYDLCGELSILETAEVLRKAQVFVGIDSGPGHIANAVGTFGIILLGKFKEFERYLPYSGHYADGTNALLIYAQGFAADISVDTVFQAVEQRLDQKVAQNNREGGFSKAGGW